MILLYTGVPGAGKTTTMVSDLVKIKGREIFSNIRGFESKPLRTMDLNDYPINAVIAIDECQEFFRVGTRIPAGILKSWETHRHRGLDVYIATQSPSQISSSIFVLVGKHHHTRLTRLAERQRLTWDNAQKSPNSPLAVSCAERTFVRLDRGAMSKFSSVVDGASQVVRRAKRSKVPYVSALVILSLLGFAGYGIYRSSSVFSPKEAEPLPLNQAASADVSVFVPPINTVSEPSHDSSLSNSHAVPDYSDDYYLKVIESVRRDTLARDAERERWEEHWRVCRQYNLPCRGIAGGAGEASTVAD